VDKACDDDECCRSQQQQSLDSYLKVLYIVLGDIVP
jgi:hypothetical protein